MNSTDLLKIIIERVGFCDAAQGAYFPADEVTQWPQEVMQLLLKAGVIKPAQEFKKTLVCTGCEDACNMLVAFSQEMSDKPRRAYIECERYDNIGRVPVNMSRLYQWHSSGDNFAALLSNLLKTMAVSGMGIRQGNEWPLGCLQNVHGYVPVSLKIANGFFICIGQSQPIELQFILQVHKDQLKLINASIQMVLEQAHSEETREERLKRVYERYTEFKRKSVRDFNKRLSKEFGVGDSRIKWLIKEAKEMYGGNQKAPLGASLHNVWPGVAGKKK